MTAGVLGGHGTILAAHWTRPNAHGTVEVVDGAGNHATTTF